MTFFIERCVPGKQKVVRFEMSTVLHCGGIRDSALERHHGFNVETHQLSVQVLQTPVIWKHTHTQTPESKSFMPGVEDELSGALMS